MAVLFLVHHHFLISIFLFLFFHTDWPADGYAAGQGGCPSSSIHRQKRQGCEQSLTKGSACKTDYSFHTSMLVHSALGIGHRLPLSLLRTVRQKPEELCI